MKIAILGTRGVPNYYGGFEQFAAYLSTYLAHKGVEIYVYNSTSHPYKDKMWGSVHIIHQHDYEKTIGTFGQFIYDLNCILDSRKRNFDIILQLGYTSSSIWSFLFPKMSLIVTNMDGLEWKRTKYQFIVQKFLHLAESIAINKSHHLVADSIGIQKYIYARYRKTSTYIAYGAELVKHFDQNILSDFALSPDSYYLIIARLEKENNVEVILDGYVLSNSKCQMIVVGNHESKYGIYLKKKYMNSVSIRFLGAIYNMDLLNNLRHYSKIYFHGHSVGGTNPSLLEAMASGAFICANKNIFNSSILGDEALYFEDYIDVKNYLIDDNSINKKDIFIQNNSLKILNNFSWDKILNEYYQLFLLLLKNKP
ncbi:MAG: DUF1972 domain-containing protein [Cytophagales bacterium]|nr:DUF1972 domain-containing protein [Cytophagales bacterium]